LGVRDRGGPTVHLLCGLPGAGRTTHARRLAAERPAVRFSLDEWMLRLYRLRYDDPEYAARQAGYEVLLHHIDIPPEVAVARARERAGTAGSHDIDETGVRHVAGIFEPPHAGEGIPIRTVVLP
jgi:predicted kinase